MTDWVEKVDDVIAVMLGGGRGMRLDPLTRLRSKPAVPVAGKFRLIDIPISNCIHSRMRRMLLLTQFNSYSLHRHITRTYRFDLFSRGFVQILAAQQTPEGEKWFQGTADAVRQNLQLITEMTGDYVLILSGDHMYRCDYRAILRDLLETDADIAIAVLPCTEKEISGFGAVRVDETGRIVEFREKPKDEASRQGMAISPQLREQRKLDERRPYLASMGVYLFRKEVLIECLANDFVDFGNDVIPQAASTRRVQAHFFRGYWRDIGTIDAFYEAHMDILSPDPPFHFNDPNWPFYTLPQYLPGARLHRSEFTRSILTEGTLITDSRIRQSIVGLRTTVRNATIRNSLIMGVDPDPPAAPNGSPPLGVGEGSVIEHAIIDKNARIGRNVTITNAAGRANTEGDGWAIRDGTVVIPKNAIIPDGTTI
jgi:glucose-1-phosphate adenylyltransferase